MSLGGSAAYLVNSWVASNKEILIELKSISEHFTNF